MGISVDLCEIWEPYKAAKKALTNTLSKSNVQEVLERHTQQIPQLNAALDKYLTEVMKIFSMSVERLTHFIIQCRVS